MGYATHAKDWEIAMAEPASGISASLLYMLRSRTADIAAVVALAWTKDAAGKDAAAQAALAEYRRLSKVGISGRGFEPIKELFKPFCLMELHRIPGGLHLMTQVNRRWKEYLLVHNTFRHFFPMTRTGVGIREPDKEGMMLVPELEWGAGRP